jgi:hypothetical protein
MMTFFTVQVIKETARLYSSLPFHIWKTVENANLGNDRILAAGSLVTVTAYFTHQYPEQFDQDLFSPENPIGRHPHAYTRVYRKIFRTGRLERELQMVQLSATRCSCIATL